MKKVFALMLVLCLCLSLTACGISEEDVVGTWTGSWVYNGNSFVEAFILEYNGTYASAMYKNGEFYEVTEGTWEIDGREVHLHEDGNRGQWTAYDYKGGKLVNNGHEFTRE